MSTPTQAKAAMRTQARAALAAIAPGPLALHSQRVVESLRAWDELARARRVMLFAPLPGEVDVAPLARWLLSRASNDNNAAAHVRVALPQTDWPTRTITPVLIEQWDVDVVPAAGHAGRLGLREPRAGCVPVGVDELDAVLVPGLAFDESGARLGRGAGFYDRLLARLSPRCLVVGVMLASQLVERVPSDPHDRRVGWLCDERGVRPALGSATT